jgi:hypothetical protein
LTFAADNSGSQRVKRTLFLLTTGLLFAAGTFAAKPPSRRTSRSSAATAAISPANGGKATTREAASPTV